MTPEHFPPPIPTELPSPAELPPVRGERLGRWLAWLVIVLATAFVVFRVATSHSPEKQVKEKSDVGAQEEISAKLTYAMRGLDPNAAQQPEVNPNTTPLGKLRKQILEAALKDAELDLDELPEGIPAETRAVLLALQAGTPPKEADLKEFKAANGWFADLVQTLPPQANTTLKSQLASAAKKIMLGASLGSLVMAAAFFAGLALLIRHLVVYKLKFPSTTWVGAPLGRSGVYLEGFAIYLLGMLGPEMLERWTPAKAGFIFNIAGMLGGSLLAIFWPLLRGIPRKEWRWNMGLHTGKGLFREMGIGLLSWLEGIPLLIVLMIVSLGLSQVFHQPMEHPIDQMIHSDHGQWLVVLLAAMYAPLTEELCFRGLLLCGLRSRWTFIWSALGSSLIFALLHPQGIAAVPVLAGLAFVFSYVRCWRGSIFPSMAAHALHNGLICVFILLLLG